jgi:hypothetical protein
MLDSYGIEIVEAYLDWVVMDDGTIEELNSEFFNYVIETDNCLLVFDKADNFLYDRFCKDLEQAEQVADTFERTKLRDKRDGTVWPGWKGIPMTVDFTAPLPKRGRMW